MVYNISFQVCGLILVTMIMLIFFRYKTLHRMNEVAFSVLLLSVFSCVVMDISSIIALRSQERIPLSLINFICKFYLLTIINVAYSLLIYTLIEVYRRRKKLFRFFLLYLLPLLAGIWIYITNPIYSYINDREIYTYGICVNATYGIAILYLLICLGYIFRFRRQINRNRLISICFLIIVWFITALIQFIHNEWLLVGFAMSLAVTFMYLKLENPDVNLDETSGAFNSHAFATYLTYLEQGGSTYSIITVIIDDYRFITETFGYKNSKLLLCEITSFLSEQKGARVFRSSEDDFSIIFEQKEYMQKALPAIRERFTKPWKVSSLSLKLSVSICYIPDSQIISSIGDSYEIIRYFITKNYKAEKSALTCIDSNAIEQKRAIDKAENALHFALANNTIQVFYQPIYSTEKNCYTCAEALVRIPDEDGHFLSPDLFIPIAEQNGLIIQLGETVFEQVCSFIHENNLAAKGVEYIEVNLSVVQCIKETLAQDFKQIMDRYDIPYSMINLEITETAAINSEAILLSNMEALRELGVTFSLDDYGSGYSNLNYIIELPVQIAKLDKNLIWSYFENKKAMVAIDFSISMLRKLGLKLVAEGIETQEQFQKMLQLKIDYIQGYYFSKPLSGREFLTALDRQS